VLRNDEVSDQAAPASAFAAFDAFVAAREPGLRRALVALYGAEDGRDATAEALAFAWEHWELIEPMPNGAGYLFRVAQSRSRRRKEPVVFHPPESQDHEFEPKLPGALGALPDHQRVAVVLVHAFGWRATEVADLLGIKPTTVQNHLERGLRRLRRALGVTDDAH
jgi:DNA-directed RNA polymerase specialized sigma24 family protein